MLELDDSKTGSAPMGGSSETQAPGGPACTEAYEEGVRSGTAHRGSGAPVGCPYARGTVAAVYFWCGVEKALAASPGLRKAAA
jgi:hypothetical protein